ncbi:MAG: AAA family ATPase, partial [Lentisphaeria bacterium]|nr:AAA family ATPase [Lentisphaeria bacterium]
MISTLKAIFQGRKKLFEGLDIARTAHPVINLNMDFCASENYDQFAQNLPREIERGLAEAVYEYDE